MKLWFADSAQFENAYLFGARRSLVSYAYIAPGNVGDRWIKGHPRDAEIFLDSGAFGVMTGRAIISLRSIATTLGRTPAHSRLTRRWM